MAAWSNQSARGPEDDVQHGDPSCGIVGLDFRAAHDAGFGLAAGRQQLARGQRLRPDSGHRVRGAAAEDGGGCHAAPDCQVAPEAGVGNADGEDFAVEEGERCGHRHGALPLFYPVSVRVGFRCGGRRRDDRECRRRPGNGQDLVPDGLHSQPARHCLDGGGRRGIPHEPVGPAERGPVECPGGGDAQGRMALPAKVLDQAVDSRGKDTEPGGGFSDRLLRFRRSGSGGLRRHLDHVADRAEPDAVARACQRGFGTVEVPHAGSGAADQLPATGGLARIDGGVVSGQRHGPRGDSGARGTPAGNFERLVLSHHVAEARGEAGESHGPDLAAVRCDHTLDTEAGQFPYFGEVFAVVHGVNDHQPAVLLRRGREVQLQEGLPMRRAAAGDSALTMTVSAAARTSCCPGNGASKSAACRARTSCSPESSARTVRVPTGRTARTLPGRAAPEGGADRATESARLA